MRLFASNIKGLREKRIGAPSCGWTGEGGTLQRLCSLYQNLVTCRQKNSWNMWKEMYTKWVAERARLHMLERVKMSRGAEHKPGTNGNICSAVNSMPKPPATTYTQIMRTFWKQAWKPRAKGFFSRVVEFFPRQKLCQWKSTFPQGLRITSFLS